MDKFSCMFKFDRLAIGAWLIGTVALCAGCEPRGTELARLYRQPPPPMSTVNYATLRATVLAPQCISCHADFGTESGLLKYVVIGDPASSALYRAVANNSMPPGGPPLAGTAVDMFKTYIVGLKTTQGTTPPTTPVETMPPAPSNPPSVAANYDGIRARILAPRCLSCHADFGTEAGLANYITPGDSEKSMLVQSITSGSMPPGGPAIGEDDQALLKTYISGLKPAN